MQRQTTPLEVFDKIEKIDIKNLNIEELIDTTDLITNSDEPEANKKFYAKKIKDNVIVPGKYNIIFVDHVTGKGIPLFVPLFDGPMGEPDPVFDRQFDNMNCYFLRFSDPDKVRVNMNPVGHPRA